MKKTIASIISGFLIVSTVLLPVEDPALRERQKLIEHYTKIAEEKHKPYTSGPWGFEIGISWHLVSSAL
ncbi:MAG TPA: hypothetical protein VGW78_06570 [Candidatus Babeliales bacterium]|jgi:hypothetical protein|nr:hypothetical protein [Candidatus Babeliales bacterium]